MLNNRGYLQINKMISGKNDHVYSLCSKIRNRNICRESTFAAFAEKAYDIDLRDKNLKII